MPSGSWTTRTPMAAPPRMLWQTASVSSCVTCSENGLATLEEGQSLPIGTRAGVRDVHRLAEGFAVDLGRWALEGGEPLVTARAAARCPTGLGISVGNPHVVVALASDGRTRVGRPQPVAPPRARGARRASTSSSWFLPSHSWWTVWGRIRMRVHERGQWRDPLVRHRCGVARGARGAALGRRVGPPTQWKVEVPGGVLGVRIFAAGGRRARGPQRPGRARLRGLARRLALRGNRHRHQRCPPLTCGEPAARGKPFWVAARLTADQAPNDSSSQRCSESEPRLRATTSQAEASSSRRGKPVFEHPVQFVLADPDRRVRPESTRTARCQEPPRGARR